MKKIGKYLILEAKEDYNNMNVWEVASNKTKTRCLDPNCLIHHNGNKKYPQYYKYSDSDNMMECGDYWPITQEEIIDGLMGEINDLEGKVKQLRDELIPWLILKG